MAKPIDHANDHDRSFQVVTQGQSFALDGVVCGTPAPVPSRRRCGVRIVGLSVETGGWMVCGDRRAESPALQNSPTPSDIV